MVGTGRRGELEDFVDSYPETFARRARWGAAALLCFARSGPGLHRTRHSLLLAVAFTFAFHVLLGVVGTSAELWLCWH